MNFEMNRILLIKPLFLHDQEVKTKIQISSDFKDQSFFFLTCNIEVLTKFQPTKNIHEKWELELMFEKILLRIIITAWKVSKYGVFSGPYFPGFGLNTDQKTLCIWTPFTQCLLHIVFTCSSKLSFQSILT